jgi:hypothetical protein
MKRVEEKYEVKKLTSRFKILPYPKEENKLYEIKNKITLQSDLSSY